MSSSSITLAFLSSMLRPKSSSTTRSGELLGDARDLLMVAALDVVRIAARKTATNMCRRSCTILGIWRRKFVEVYWLVDAVLL